MCKCAPEKDRGKENGDDPRIGIIPGFVLYSRVRKRIPDPRIPETHGQSTLAKRVYSDDGRNFYFSRSHVAPGGSRPTHGKARSATVVNPIIFCSCVNNDAQRKQGRLRGPVVTGQSSSERALRVVLYDGFLSKTEGAGLPPVSSVST